MKHLHLEICEQCHEVLMATDEGVEEPVGSWANGQNGAQFLAVTIPPGRTTPPAFETNFWSPPPVTVTAGPLPSEPTGAKHFDENKLPVQDISAEVLFAIAEVLLYGEKKYGRDNWLKGMAWRKLLGSILRHLLKFKRGEDIDEESGHLHLAMAATDTMMLLDYVLNGRGTDDRVKTRG